MKTQVVTNEDFNGRKQFKVYEVDEDGNKAFEFDRNTGEKKDKKPIVNIGLTKAIALVNNADALIKFVDEN